MSDQATKLILGEFRRTIDDRFRVSLPLELVSPLVSGGGEGDEQECLLVKERPGAISLWNAERWSESFDRGVQLIEAKIAAGRLAGQTGDVLRLGRLLSTRHRTVRIAGRGRLLIPEGFREFLGVEPGGEILIVGAALCIEIWRPDAWLTYLDEQISEFRPLYDSLSA
jgi:MraZ protein